MKIIKKLKSMFGKEKPSRGNPGTPAKMLSTRHKDYARRAGVSGDRSREIVRHEEGKEKVVSFPYRKEIVEAYKDKRSMPIFPEDGNNPNPKYDVLDRYDPGTVKWD